MLRKFGSMVAGVALLLSSASVAFAGTDPQQPQAQQGALMPGKPAGVQEAQVPGLFRFKSLLIGGLVGGAGFVLFAVVQHNSNSKKAASTTTTVKP